MKLIHKVEGIVLHEWKEKVKSEREATISIEAYKRFMFEEDGALVYSVKYAANLFEIDYELLKQKTEELEKQEEIKNDEDILIRR